MIELGELRAVRIGASQRLRVRKADLERYVEKLPTTRENGAAMLRKLRAG